jgi:hypothetical protein
MSPTDAFNYLRSSFAELAPDTSVFLPDLGKNGLLDIGDYLVIHQLDPVFGTGAILRTTGVYVSENTPSSFTLVTEEGHPEAGAIRFSITGNDDALMLTISSEATSGSVADYLAYVFVAKVLQTDVWGTFLYNSAHSFATSSSTASAQMTYDVWREPRYEIAPTYESLRQQWIAKE